LVLSFEEFYMQKNLMKAALLAAAALSNSALVMQAHAADASGTDTTVVLVHGAFADGSSWNKVIPLLQAKGLKTVAVQNPLTSLADDVAAAQRVIEAQTGKVILVGHSWGGTVITQAGTSDKVKALVYVAALAPSEGQNSAELGKDYPPTEGIKTVKPDAGGFLYLPADSVAKNFAQDLPAATTRLMAATQGPIQSKAFEEPVTVASWKNKPSYYVVASKDRMIQPALEQAFAKKINASTTVLPTSHVPMLSQPEKVAEVIIRAATTR
jgi:pimeloyl-ACP methyl ester carboxylesterase